MKKKLLALAIVFIMAFGKTCATDVSSLPLDPNLYSKFLIYYQVVSKPSAGTPYRIQFADGTVGTLASGNICTIGNYSMQLSLQNIQQYFDMLKSAGHEDLSQP